MHIFMLVDTSWGRQYQIRSPVATLDAVPEQTRREWRQQQQGPLRALEAVPQEGAGSKILQQHCWMQPRLVPPHNPPAAQQEMPLLLPLLLPLTLQMQPRVPARLRPPPQMKCSQS
jgi:hypothetical protein